MKKTLHFALVAVLSLIAQMVCANTTRYSYNVTQYTITATDNGYTLAFGEDFDLTAEKGTGSSKPTQNTTSKDLRHYASNTLTVTSNGEDGMTEITFTISAAGKKRLTDLTASTGTVTVDAENYVVTWNSEDPVKEVTFTVGAKATYGTDGSSKAGQFNFDEIDITTTDDGEVVEEKKDAGLKFSTETYDYELGTVWNVPELTMDTDAEEFTLTSDNPEVVYVDDDYSIWPTGKEGKAVITVTTPETDNYKAGTATCTIYVWHYNLYVKANAIESGKKYLLVAQRGDSVTAYAYPASESKTYSYLSAGVINDIVDTIQIKSSYDDAFTFTGADGVYSIKDCYGRYLYNDGSHNTFSFIADEEKTWEVEPQEDGTFKFLFGDYYIQWGQGTHTSFGVYATDQENAVLPYLYKLVEEDDVHTGITTVDAQKTVKSDAIYNLAGQRVGKNYKGIVIMDGKKYMQK